MRERESQQAIILSKPFDFLVVKLTSYDGKSDVNSMELTLYMNKDHEYAVQTKMYSQTNILILLICRINR